MIYNIPTSKNTYIRKMRASESINSLYNMLDSTLLNNISIRDSFFPVKHESSKRLQNSLHPLLLTSHLPSYRAYRKKWKS